MGAEEEEEDAERFEEKMERLVAELSEQMKQSQELDVKITGNLERIGYGS